MRKLQYIILLFALTSCWRQDCNCGDFKTGNFKSEIEIKGVKKSVLFSRTKNLQIEYFDGKIDSSSVRWVNDCEFVTRKLHPKTMEEQKSFSVKMLATSFKTYIAEYNEVGKYNKKTAIVTKVE